MIYMKPWRWLKIYSVILAGGYSNRFYPFRDKPLYKIMGKALIEYWIDAVKEISDEVVVITNKENNEKIKKLGVKTIVQNKHGIPHAIKKIPFSENVLLINSNDFIDFNLLKRIKEEGTIFYKKVDNYVPGGYILNENGISIIEKPGEEILNKTRMFNIMIHYHPRFSDIVEEMEKLGLDDEANYEVAVSKKAKNYKLIKVENHFTIKYPFHVLDAINVLLKIKENKINGEVSKNSIVKNSYIAENAKVGDFSKVVNSYIGSNTVIGDHTLIRDSIIEDNCMIGRSEIARSHINDNVGVHGSYIGDSVIGKNVNFGFGSVTANMRHDGKEIYFYTKDGKKVPTGRKKLGAFVKDNVHLGIMTKIYPGRIVDRNTLPGEEVRFLKNE